MRLTINLAGRFIPWKYTPGALWSGKERKLPRLTHGRKSAFLDHLLLCDQNSRLLKRPYIDRETEAVSLENEEAAELAREDQVFYNRYAQQFHNRFVTRKVEQSWSKLINSKRFDL